MTFEPANQKRSTAVAIAEAETQAISIEALESSPSRRSSPLFYVLLVFALVGLSMFSVWSANRLFAPEMYDTATPAAIGATLASGQNYAVFDLNVNIREIRNAQLAGLPARPDVILLGASHWQEAHVDLLADRSFFNAHIHRDYFEDILGMVEMLVRHDKLPRHMMISIRDNQFLPIRERTDYLWLPGIPFYRDMSKRLGLMPQSQWDTWPVARWRERLSLPMLYGNASRWYKAQEHPHPTLEARFDRLDVLLAGGSIAWSRQHEASYTAERSLQTTMAYVNARRNAPPTVDPIGIEQIDRLFGYLAARGVHVVLVHPPFNPIAYDALKSERYIEGLRRVESLTRDFADRHGFDVIGSFDPYVVGCHADMYIDAEHANPTCLAKVFDQFSRLPRSKSGNAVEASIATIAAQEPNRIDPLPPPPLQLGETPAGALPEAHISPGTPIVTIPASETTPGGSDRLPTPTTEPIARDASSAASTEPSAGSASKPQTQPRKARKGTAKARASTAPRTTRAATTSVAAKR